MNTIITLTFCILVTVHISRSNVRPPIENEYFPFLDIFFPAPNAPSNVSYNPPVSNYNTGNNNYYRESTESTSYKKIIISSIMPPDGIVLISPRWSMEENVLYFSDKYAEKFYRFDPEQNNLTIVDIGYGPAGIIEPVQGAPGTSLVALRSALYLFVWDSPTFDGELRQLTSVDLGKPDNLVTSVRIDATGRAWFGTMGKTIGLEVKPDQGTLYSMTYKTFKSPAIKIRPVTEPIGITFSKDNKKMFYNDGPKRKIMAYDFVLETGDIGNETIVYDFDASGIAGQPLDMTIDSDDNLWVPTNYGSKILKINSKSGELMDAISLPVDQVIAVTWGGRDLSTLYVATGKYLVEKPKPLSGCLLAITNTGARGQPPPAFVYPNAKSIAAEGLQINSS